MSCRSRCSLLQDDKIYARYAHLLDLLSLRVSFLHHLFVLLGGHPRARFDRCFF